MQSIWNNLATRLFRASVLIDRSQVKGMCNAYDLISTALLHGTIFTVIGAAQSLSVSL